MKHLKKIIKESLDDRLFDNPKFSLNIGALYKGKKVLNESFGKKYKVYDLASMTKAIFPSFTIINNHPELLDKKISDVLPWLNESNLKVSSLLTHTSGLPAHKKIYLDLKDENNILNKKYILKRLLRTEFNKLKPNLKPRKVYSDVGYLLLGEVLEAYLSMPLERIWEFTKYSLKLPSGFKFSVSKKDAAPTEICSWREKEIQGEVFDDNAYALGGVQPHAGLFGNMQNMLYFGSLIRESYKKNKKYYQKKSEGFATGFEMPSGKLSNAGSLFSSQSIGHLGFTGTSFWFDPKVDLFICILSNRTYPDRSDFSFNKYRPVIQDLIYKNVVKK